ncbi:MAG: hypothetical protein B6245_22230 [Desulfobacteraceae bacterium 4572_88]|nr:MAG: hypothetical protein B6245_22230 [Desulfobacteraceae bacterium 4572_88]
MENLKIEPSKDTPEISFDFKKNLLNIKGYSYPENASKFYDPVFSWLEDYMSQSGDDAITANLEIICFNSSSTKILMDFFDLLEEAFFEKGRDVIVNWIYDEENENALEAGEDFQEELEGITFNLVEKAE